jgi:two-component system CheB/CheR fusion protein
VRRVREMVIFAQQNIITDPPFSKVDLICCRNVLIYLQPVLQKKVISAFQFGLNPDGYLFLGTSETIGDSEDFFQAFHSKWKIYQYKGGFRPSLEDNRQTRMPMAAQPGLKRRYAVVREDWRVVDGIQRGVIEAFSHPTAVVDENLDMVYTAGDLDAYLRVPSGGLFTANILKQAREGLSVPLSTAIHKVFKDSGEVNYRNIRLGDSSATSLIDVRARAFIEPSSRQKLAVIQFVPAVEASLASADTTQTFDINVGAQQRIQDLEHELQFTRESLQATVEELETSNEELQATNEELFAANEELQSTNEELHSVNEELITVNAEYHAKIKELTKLNEDINNLLGSADVGTIFLDRDLQVRLFTPSAQKGIHLLEQDIGRPISHVTHTLIDCDLVHEAQQVLITLASHEREIQTADGHWYQVKFMPYFTLSQQVAGVVVTLVDVTAFKQTNMQLARLSVAVEQSPASIVITDTVGNIEYVNPRFTQITGYTPEEVRGKNPRLLKTHKTPFETYQQLWQTISAGREWKGEFVNRKKNGELFYEYASISPIVDSSGNVTNYLAVKENITERKQAEVALQESEKRYRFLLASLPDIAILVFDCEFRYLVAGGGELARAGFDKQRVEGHTLSEAFPPQVVELFKPLYQKTLAGETSSFAHEYNGQTYHQTIVPLRDEGGKIYAGMVMAHNITSRVEMENALRLSLEKYRVLFDSFPLGITIADRDGRILESNHEAERILGLKKEKQTSLAIDGSEWQIIRTDGSLMPADEYASVRALKEKRLVENVEMGIVKKKGEVAWITVTAVPLGDYGVVIAYREIAGP